MTAATRTGARAILAASRLALVAAVLAAAASAGGAAASSDAGTATAISSGNGGHTCAVTSAGGLKCWGMNIAGQLGDGTTDRGLAPVDVVGLSSGVSAVAAGHFHTCALTSQGGVKCWGLNVGNQLGDGTTTDRLTPVDVVGLASGVAAISAGSSSCAVTSEGAAKCWGGHSTTPADVPGLSSGVVAIAVGGSHRCALTREGAVKCWGGNAWGQLGDGTTTDRSAPVGVVGLAGGVTQIAAGFMYTCALTIEGTARCWGRNDSGQLGDGTTTDQSIPVAVTGLTSGVSAIEAAQGHTCAIQDGVMKCWGGNAVGQLGDGTRTDRLTPADVVGLAGGVTAIAVGAGHSCALTAGGAIKCWGANTTGQLGNGGAMLSPLPVGVVGFPGIQTRLQLALSGNGAGRIQSAPAGLDCMSACAHAFELGASVALTATPAPGSAFAGWSGACSGTGTCTLTMDADRSLTATFALTSRTLTVTKLGPGDGTVTSSPAAIDCGAACAAAFAHGRQVALTATPAPGSVFAGWSGACTGSGACTVTLDQQRDVTATFEQLPPPPVVRCVVPKLKGKTLAAARTALKRANCSLGKVARAFSPRVAKGRVISQRPTAGKLLARGARVNVVVSKGRRG